VLPGTPNLIKNKELIRAVVGSPCIYGMKGDSIIRPVTTEGAGEVPPK
jgi:hypothetical protein